MITAIQEMPSLDRKCSKFERGGGMSGGYGNIEGGDSMKASLRKSDLS